MPTVELEEDDLEDDQVETPEEEALDQADTDDVDDGEEQEEVATISMEGEEDEIAEDAEAPPKLVHAVKATRTRLKEINRENRELRSQVESLKRAQTQPPEQLGPKPTLESSGFDGDKFEADLDAWKERKRKIEAQAETIQKQKEDQDRAWKQTLADYQSEKSQLVVKARLKDYDDAEADWKEIFSDEQQGIVLHASKKKPALVYYLGKHPDKAHALAGIKDHVKLIYAIAELEAKLSVKTTTTRPAVDTPVRSGGAVQGRPDRIRDKLSAEAERTGDWTKVFAHDRDQRQKKR